MSKFFLVFSSVFLFFFFWAGVLAVGGVLLKTADEIIGGTVIVIAIAGFVIGLLPFMQWVSGRVFSYPSDAPPITETELREKILAINETDSPYLVEERRQKLVVTWNYVDAEWWNILSKSGMSKIYELHIKFDEENHTATFIDVHKSIQWRAGPTDVKIRGGFSRGIDLTYQREVGYGWNEEGQFERVVDYEFRNSDLKNPLVNLFVENGWRVKFGLW